MNHKSVSRKTCVIVWAALMLLLLLTWGLSQFNLGAANASAAVLIAFVKMLLVITFFMQVRYQPRLTWFFAGAGFLWLLIMISLTMTDYLTRGQVRRPDSSAIRGTAEEIGFRRYP